MDKYIHRENLALLRRPPRGSTRRNHEQGDLEVANGGGGKRHVSVTQIMNHRGVDFILTQVEPGLWKWRFQIGEAVTTGRAEAKLIGLAAPELNNGLTASSGSRTI
jgi:hypothetical protein